MTPPDDDILLFDGVCNLCNGLVRFIIKRDPKEKFKFASLQSESGKRYLRELGIAENEFESLVLIKRDKFFLKSTGALNILKDLGGFWAVFYILVWVPKPLRDFFYDRIAKSRYKLFGKRDACMVPNPEISSRFL